MDGNGIFLNRESCAHGLLQTSNEMQILAEVCWLRVETREPERDGKCGPMAVVWRETRAHVKARGSGRNMGFLASTYPHGLLHCWAGGSIEPCQVAGRQHDSRGG